MLINRPLRALIDALGVELTAARAITRAPSVLSARMSFKLSFADGRTLKGRCIESAERCAVLFALAPVLKEFPLTRIVAHQENALLEEWIPGTPFEQYNTGSEQFEAAGALLGRLSQVRYWPVAAVRSSMTMARLIKQIERRLSSLAHQAKLLPDTAEHLRILAAHNKPQKLETGLIHHDFCADNLIITPDASIFAVDNEDMRIGILDADLARTCCRWPMTQEQRRLFYAGYRRFRNPDGFLHHAIFWSVWALSGSAWFHTQRELPCDALIDCLQCLADGDKYALWPDAA